MQLHKRGQYWHYLFGLDGERYRGSTKETSRTKAERKALAVMAEVQAGKHIAARKKTTRLVDLAEKFTSWVDASSLDPDTKRYYKNGWRILKTTPLAQMRLTQISRDEVDAVSLPGKPSYRAQALRTLRRMLSKAVDWKLIHAAPKVKLPKRTRRTAIISGEQEHSLLAHAKPKLIVPYLLITDCSLRPDEIARARVEHINWERKSYYNENGKSADASRFVPLSDRVLEALKGHVKDRKEGWLFPSKRSKETGHVHEDTLAHWFATARKAAGLPESLVLYSGRHTFATDALAGTGNVAAVMHTMGHSDPETLMIYQHPELDSVREAINKRNQRNAELIASRADANATIVPQAMSEGVAEFAQAQ